MSAWCRALELNRRAAAEGDYPVAYHLLMAALHAADRARDAQGLELIIARAREQSAAVEAVQPAHPLARVHAHARGQTALFDSLFAHIEAVRLRWQSDRQRAQRHP
jgi:hypothetical protein